MKSINLYESFKVRYLFGVFLAVAVSTYISADIVNLNNENPCGESIPFLTTLLITSFWSLYYCHKTSINALNFFSTKTFKSVDWLELFILGCMMFAFGYSYKLLILSINLIPEKQILQDILYERSIAIFQNSFKPGSISQHIFNALTSFIIGPICEEFLFRGIILNRWQKKWGTRKAIILTAIVFSAGHSFAPIPSLGGLLLSLIFVKYKSLLVCMIIHILHNSLFSFPVFLPEGAAIFTEEELTNFLHQIIDVKWLSTFTIMFVVNLFFILRFIIKNFPKRS